MPLVVLCALAFSWVSMMHRPRHTCLWPCGGPIAVIDKRMLRVPVAPIPLQVMHRETMAYINELTGANCITKGHFYDTTKGEAPGPGDERKIYLLIEGATPQQVGSCSEAVTVQKVLPCGGCAAHKCLAHLDSAGSSSSTQQLVLLPEDSRLEDF